MGCDRNLWILIFRAMLLWLVLGMPRIYAPNQ